MFKQWKEKYLVLTVEGNLMVCRDADMPPDQVVALQSNCESIVEGKEILDLPRLPPGGRRDSCFALILPQDKFLLLLSDSPEECSQWLKLLRKVKEGVTSPLVLQRQQSITPCITDREPLPDISSDKEPTSPHLSDKGLISPRVRSRENSIRHRGAAQFYYSLIQICSDITMVLWMWCYGNIMLFISHSYKCSLLSSDSQAGELLAFPFKGSCSAWNYVM
ncbi:hypothetical protein PO909_002598 [Leuciscus waleckii]